MTLLSSQTRYRPFLRHSFSDVAVAFSLKMWCLFCEEKQRPGDSMALPIAPFKYSSQIRLVLPPEMFDVLEKHYSWKYFTF